MMDDLASNAVRATLPAAAKDRPMTYGTPPEPLAYSIADAIRVTSIKRTRLYQLIKEGRLESRKIGNRTIIPAASLRALIEGGA